MSKETATYYLANWRATFLARDEGREYCYWHAVPDYDKRIRWY